jgi:sulfate/thiosulfate transport system permease protein
MSWRWKHPSVLPGFSLGMGYTLLYLSLIVLIPMAALFLKAFTLTWTQFLHTVTSARVLASFRLTFGAALAAASINAVFGFLVAWTLARRKFPGRRIADALVDLPFALPTAVSGIALMAVYSPSGWIGRFLEPLGIRAVLSPLGVTIALTFIGLPFVVRTLQPAIAELSAELEEAAESLGAGRWQTFRRVIFPSLLPSLVTGFTLAFARALGEYGSVVFISGNLPGKTQISAFLIVAKLDEFDYAGATAIAVVMLLASFVLLLAVNSLQGWVGRRSGVGA